MKRYLAALISLPAITFALVAHADVINSVSFTGLPTSPTITVSGSGFGTAPTATTLGLAGFTGYDYGNDLYITDLSTAHGFAAGQGEAGVNNHDLIGLNILSYTDSQIVLQLGSDYAQYYYPNGIYALAAGDPYTVVVNGASFSGIAGAITATPEPGSILLLLTAAAGFGTLRLRRRVVHP